MKGFVKVTSDQLSCEPRDDEIDLLCLDVLWTIIFGEPQPMETAALTLLPSEPLLSASVIESALAIMKDILQTPRCEATLGLYFSLCWESLRSGSACYQTHYLIHGMIEEDHATTSRILASLVGGGNETNDIITIVVGDIVRNTTTPSSSSFSAE